MTADEIKKTRIKEKLDKIKHIQEQKSSIHHEEDRVIKQFLEEGGDRKTLAEVTEIGTVEKLQYAKNRLDRIAELLRKKDFSTKEKASALSLAYTEDLILSKP